jgi:hypothetical protein
VPNASYIGFTGTPLFKDDEVTRRVFGDYVSTYDFQRAVEDNATVPLYYDARGDKLGIAVGDLNERIAEKLEELETVISTSSSGWSRNSSAIILSMRCGYTDDPLLGEPVTIEQIRETLGRVITLVPGPGGGEPAVTWTTTPASDVVAVLPK